MNERMEGSEVENRSKKKTNEYRDGAENKWKDHW